MGYKVIDEGQPTGESYKYRVIPETPTADQVNVSAKADKQTVDAPLTYKAFGISNDTPIAGGPRQPSYQPSTADYNARQKDAAYSVLNVPRDIVEGTLALPSIADRFEQWAIAKGKEKGGYLGNVANTYEAIDKTLMPRALADNLPTEQQIQQVTTPALRAVGLPKELSDPYQSQTMTGQALRTGLNVIAPMVGSVRTAAAARQPLQTVAEARNLKNAAYDVASRTAGDRYPAQYNQMAADVSQAAAREGVNPTLHPQTAAAVRRINEGVQGGPPSAQTQWYNAFGGTPPPQPRPVDFREIEQLRQGLVKAERSAIPGQAEHYHAGQIRQAIDDSLDAMAANSPEYAHARNLNVIYRRTEALDNLIQDARDLAQRSGGNEMEAIQKALFNKTQRSTVGDVRWMNQFPPPMRQMIREAAMQPGRMQRLLGFLSKDYSLLAAVLGGAPAAGAAKTVSGGAGFIRSKLSGMTPRMLRDLERQARGLQPLPNNRAGSYLGPATVIAGGLLSGP